MHGSNWRAGCTFDLWADDVPTCPIEIRAGGEIWVKPLFGYADPVGHWRQRLEDGLAHNLNLVIAKAVEGQLAAGQSSSDVLGKSHCSAPATGMVGIPGSRSSPRLASFCPSYRKRKLHLALFSRGRVAWLRIGDGAAPRRERDIAGKSARPRHLEAVVAALGIRAAPGMRPNAPC